ncbi:hypothetical protein [Blastococcus sp. SYSU DS0616]
MRNEELFFEQLDAGHQYALFVGLTLITRGFTVQVPPSRRRERVEDRHAWAQEIDLYVGRTCMDPDHHHHYGRIPLEVKSRKLEFTSVEDYPRPPAFVDTKSGWDKKDPKPNAVILVSQVTKAMLVIRSSTSDRWGTVQTTDRVRHITDVWLTCPQDAMQSFDDFCAELRQYLGTCRL